MPQAPARLPVEILTLLPRLPPSLRTDLERIARVEGMRVEAICRLVWDRLLERHRRHGDVPDPAAALPSALERLVTAYDQHAAGTVEVAMRAINGCGR